MLGHRAMWEAVNGSIPKDKCVLHSCDNRCCINPEHLFLGTRQDNTNDMIAKGRENFIGLTSPLLRRHPTYEKQARGERNGSAKLTADLVRQIRAKVAAGTTQQDAAKEFGLRQCHVSRLVRHLNWKHVA